MLNFSSVVTFSRSEVSECYFTSRTATQSYLYRLLSGHARSTELYGNYTPVPELAYVEGRKFVMTTVLLFRAYEKDIIRVAKELSVYGAEYGETASPSVLCTCKQDGVPAPEEAALNGLTFNAFADTTGSARLDLEDTSLKSISYVYGNGFTFGGGSAVVSVTGCAFWWTAQSKKTEYSSDGMSITARSGITGTPTFTCFPCVLTLFFGPYAEDAIPSEFSACIQLRSASTS